jgi:RNA polymerase sigma-70 factor (ECF subfamily)
MDQDIRQLLSQRHRDRAFEVLLQRYQTKVFRLVFSIVGNPSRAEEVTQDAFLKIWRALPGYDGRASLSTWVYTIARNTSISYLRAESYRKAIPLEEAPEPFAEGEPVLTRIETERLLANLPEEQREIVVLFYLQERSIDDVAAMLDLPEGTVKSHLHRARKAMAAMMEVRR